MGFGGSGGRRTGEAFDRAVRYLASVRPRYEDDVVVLVVCF